MSPFLLLFTLLHNIFLYYADYIYYIKKGDKIKKNKKFFNKKISTLAFIFCKELWNEKIIKLMLLTIFEL